MTSDSNSAGAIYLRAGNLSPFGMFTNDALFAKLGMKVPQTFWQLLAVCRTARAKGTAAVLSGGARPSTVLCRSRTRDRVREEQAWNGSSGRAPLRSTGPRLAPGATGVHRHEDAGCFQPGVTGRGSGCAIAAFAQEKADGPDAHPARADRRPIPEFSYSFHPFPGGTTAGQTRTFVGLGDPLRINAHSSAANRAHPKTFIDFVARPKQDALFAQLTGGLTQYEVLKGQVPSFMSGSPPVLKATPTSSPGSDLVEPERRDRAPAGRDRPDHRPGVDRRRPERDGCRLEAGPLLARARGVLLNTDAVQSAGRLARASVLSPSIPRGRGCTITNVVG